MFIEKGIRRSHQTPRFGAISTPAVTINMGEALAEYLYWKSSYAPTAALRYADRLKRFIDFCGPHILVSQIVLKDIVEFHQNMRDEGYSGKTVEYSCIIIKNFFTFWAGRGICLLNPAEIRPLRVLSPLKELISPDNFLQMSNALDERFFDELTRKLAIHMLWDCGMRVSELCALNISDIEETDRPGIRCARIERRKTTRYNIVTWGPETNRLLNLYLGLRLCIDNETDALFTHKGRNTRITARSIQRWIKEVAELAGLEKNLSPHCFRHSKAHRVLDKSANVRDVQCVLGHSSPISSFHYLGLNKERQVEVSEKYLD